MKNLTTKFSPAYISGLVQADGSFFIGIDKAVNSSLGLRVTPKFILSQHIRAKPLFEELKLYLNSGHVVTNRSEVNYVINSLPQIKEKILPLIDQYPVRAGKLDSYLKFKQVIEMMNDKQHLNKEGLAKIIDISYGMNLASSRTQEKKLELFKLIEFNQEINIENPPTPVLPPINPEFVSGLTDGDGSFFISFRAYGRITPSFTVIQDSSCEDVLIELTKYFNCGTVYHVKSANAYRFQVESLEKIINNVIPHFKNNPLFTEKKTHFEIFSQVCDLLQSNTHKTNDGLLQIIDLAYNMNKEGKGRRLTKEEFICNIKSKLKSEITDLDDSK